MSGIASVLCWTLAALALLPLALCCVNLYLLRPPPPAVSRRRISVLIPARDEERAIGTAIESVLANRDVEIELIVLDDDSADATARIVRERAVAEPRLRLISGRQHDPTLWGKPQACAELAAAASGEILVFMDADVRLAPDALGRIAAALERSRAAMLSGVPRQITSSLVERLVVPLIHFVLLGFLPLVGMRASARADFGVACGQLLAVEREAYAAAGGHRAIAHHIHDGMALARAFRRAGYRTDLADFTDLARCRMYRSTRELVAGFAKNAHEGLGSARGILPWSILLLGGQTAWLALSPLALSGRLPALPVAVAGAAAYASRLLLDARFGRIDSGTALHPLGVLALVSIQWYALARRLAGRPVAWKARLPESPGARCKVSASGVGLRIQDAP